MLGVGSSRESQTALRRPTRHFATITLAVTGLMMVVASGASADPVINLRVAMIDDGFDLSWSAPERADRDDVELQLREQSRGHDEWIDETGWEPLGTAGRSGKMAYIDAVEHHRYQFRARVDGGRWSPPVNRLFVRPTLPVIRLDTVGYADIRDRKKHYRDATFSLEPTGTDAMGLRAPVRIRGRGNTTWDEVDGKKSYQIKFESKEALLGMPSSKRWVLRANFFDRSQLRNWTANQIAKATKLAWTPETRWVELVLNGDYRGIYEVTEKIDVAKDKVDVPKLEPDITGDDDITGGYLLEIDRNANKVGEHDGWTSETGYPVYIERPEPEDSNPEQRAYIQDHFTKFERALYDDDFTDPDTGYRGYLDVPSFIDYWIVEELSLDTDSFHWSTYIYKDRGDPLLHFGPVWDFDRSMGSSASRLGTDPEGWFTIHPGIAMEDGTRTWAFRLFEDPSFVDEVDQRWRRALPALEQIPDEIIKTAPALERAKASDLLRWADETDTLAGRRYGVTVENDEPEFLARWIDERLAWMSTELGRLAAGGDIGPAVELNEK